VTAVANCVTRNAATNATRRSRKNIRITLLPTGR
jgi:hypothetical protein